jgi:hypothetical protein
MFSMFFLKIISWSGKELLSNYSIWMNMLYSLFIRGTHSEYLNNGLSNPFQMKETCQHRSRLDTEH